MYDTSHQPETMQVRYKFLPSTITDLFEYRTVELVIDETTKEFGLNEEKRGALLMEIELVLFLFLTRKGFVERLRESLEIDQGRATQIAAKIESDLFSLIDAELDVAEAEFEANEVSALDEVSSIDTPISTSTNVQQETIPPQSQNLIVEPQISPVAPSIPEPTTIVPPLATVKPMRTFPDDFNAGRAHSYGAFRPEGDDNDPDETTHSSSQDDVLRK